MKFVSKRILFAALVVVVLGSIVYITKYRPIAGENSAQTSITREETPLIGIESTLQNTDSDNDGLKDWEETIWGTDPQNPDTDKDGTKDGAEVNSDRDPRVKGPNDKRQGNSSRDISETAIGDVKNLNTTQKLGRSIFIKYLSLKKNGADLTDEDQKVILNSAINEITLTIQYKTYTAKNLIVGPISDVSAARAYADAMAIAVKKNSPKQVYNELALLGDIAENGDDDGSKTRHLKEIVASYKAIIKAYLAIPVPQDALEKHLAFINAMSAVTTNIEGFSVAGQDIVVSLAHITPYSVHVDQMTAAFNSLVGYFAQKGVVFNEQSPGHIFTVEMK